MFSRYKKVFLAKDDKLSIFDKVDIVLSPEFYWVKREALPVKYSFQAKKLAPSIFDGYLPKGKYKYFAIKDGDKFLLFAYDNSYIIDKLQKLNIDTNNINNVYFAQNELDRDTFYEHNGKIYFFMEGLLSAFDSSMVEAQSVELNSNIPAKSSGYKISLDKYNLPIEQKTYNVLSISLMIFIVLMLVDAFKLDRAISNAMSQNTQIIKKHNLPKTSWQIDSVLKSSKAKMSEQIKIRDSIFEVLKVPLQKGEFFKKIDFAKKEIDVVIVLNEPKRAEIIKNHIQKTLKLDKIKVVDNTLFAKVRYE